MEVYELYAERQRFSHMLRDRLQLAGIPDTGEVLRVIDDTWGLFLKGALKQTLEMGDIRIQTTATEETKMVGSEPGECVKTLPSIIPSLTSTSVPLHTRTSALHEDKAGSSDPLSPTWTFQEHSIDRTAEDEEISTLYVDSLLCSFQPEIADSCVGCPWLVSETGSALDTSGGTKL